MISGQTFVFAGDGDDQFNVGEGTVDQLDGALFLRGEDGNDSVLIANQDTATTAATLEKSTVQRTYERNRLNKVTNALEFTITDPDENNDLGDALQTLSIPYAQDAANADRDDLQQVATRAANELGESIESRLQSASDDFDAAVDRATLQQQNLQRTLVENTLVDYYRTRNAKETLTANYNALQASQQSVINAINGMIQGIFEQVINTVTSTSINLGFFKLDFSYSVQVTSNPTIDEVLSAYTAATKTFTIELETTTVLTVNGGSQPPIIEEKWYTLPADAALDSAIASFLTLRTQSNTLLREIKVATLQESNAKSALQPYFTDQQNQTYGFSNAELNTFYADAKSDNNDVSGRAGAVRLTQTNAEFASSLTKIASEIDDAKTDAESAFTSALAAADTLSTATTGISSLASLLTTELNSLLAQLQSGIDASNSWDTWIHLERLQVVPDVLFNNEIDAMMDVIALDSVIPPTAAFLVATEFAAEPNPTWDQTKTFFNSSEFAAIAHAYDLANDIAEEFNDYKSTTYTDFRSVRNNIRNTETARTFLQNGFNFETFKSAYLANVADLSNVISQLDLVAEEAQYEAQLKALKADQRRVNALVGHNLALVNDTPGALGLFNVRAAFTQNNLTQVEALLASEYSFSVNWLFGYTFMYDNVDYSNDPRFIVAKAARDEAAADLTQATNEAIRASADKAILDQRISDIEDELSEVQNELDTGTTNLDALKETLEKSISIPSQCQ